jgi:hypothetical protein
MAATPFVSAVDAAFGAPSAAAAGAAPSGFVLLAIQRRLRAAKETHISWHDVLESHACPPEMFGNRLCASLTACKKFDLFGSMHRCRLVLPNSYVLDDGKVVEAEEISPDKQTADEDACFTVFALLCADPDGLAHVVFRPGHWNLPRNYLIDNISRIWTRFVSKYIKAVQPLAR